MQIMCKSISYHEDEADDDQCVVHDGEIFEHISERRGGERIHLITRRILFTRRSLNFLFRSKVT